MLYSTGRYRTMWDGTVRDGRVPTVRHGMVLGRVQYETVQGWYSAGPYGAVGTRRDGTVQEMMYETVRYGTVQCDGTGYH